MRDQEFGHLRAFFTVARELNFSRAAQSLGVSPSALTQTIKGLGEGQGVRLLNRSTRRVTTTETKN